MEAIRDKLRRDIELLDDGAAKAINEIVERLLVAVDFDYTYVTRQEDIEIEESLEDLRNGNTISLDEFMEKHC